MSEDKFGYDEDTFTWSQRQADALRRRDLDAIDWEHVTQEIEALGRDEKTDWVSWCTLTIKWMLLIEHYPSKTGRLRRWRDEAWRMRVDLHYAGLRNRGLLKQLEELLAESWQVARAAAITAMARYDTGGRPGDVSLVQELRERWEKHIPAECPYSWPEIIGKRRAHRWSELIWADPRLDCWPPAVARRLNDALGTNYPIQPEPGGEVSTGR